jgi:triosephosphate isomerase
MLKTHGSQILDLEPRWAIGQCQTIAMTDQYANAVTIVMLQTLKKNIKQKKISGKQR